MEPENLRAKEMEDEDHGDLIDSLSYNLFDHVNGEQRIHLLVGLAIKLDWGCLVRRQRKGGKGIHDKVHSKQLNRAQYRFFL